MGQFRLHCHKLVTNYKQGPAFAIVNGSSAQTLTLREEVNRKKTFSFGGVYPCPNFLALFLEVHFRSIKRVYFFKNADVLNF